jgi:putative membrane protein
MMWFHGIGWSWADCIQEGLVTVVLWGALITAIILAVGFLTRQRSDPLASRDTGSIRIEYLQAQGSARGEMDNAEWHRRLMQPREQR